MNLFSWLHRFDSGCVVSFGNFDGVHLGHSFIISLLVKEARKRGVPSVIVTFDPHPVEFLCGKKNFQIMSFKDRIKFLEKLGVDALCIVRFDENFASITAIEFLKMLQTEMNAQCLIVSEKCSFGKGASGNFSLVAKMSTIIGYEFIIVDILQVNGMPCSSSVIRELIQSGNVSAVQKFLGRRYYVTGTVLRGDGIAGKVLSFPTANIKFDELLPKLGVYVAEVFIESMPERFFGVVNIGVRPTLRTTTSPSVEVHILNFNSDLYGKEISVHFLDFIREEIKFDSVKSLSNQIASDVEYAMSYLRGSGIEYSI